MSWCVGKSSSSSLRYLSIRSRNSLARAIVMRLPVAILVAATRLQKFLKSWFSRLSGGRRPHRRPKVTTRCTVQNTRHPSADILPWLFSPIRGGAGEHQEGNVVFSMSSQIFLEPRSSKNTSLAMASIGPLCKRKVHLVWDHEFVGVIRNSFGVPLPWYVILEGSPTDDSTRTAFTRASINFLFEYLRIVFILDRFQVLFSSAFILSYSAGVF